MVLIIFKNLTSGLIAIYLETVGDKRVSGFKYQLIVNIYDKFQLFCFHNKNMELQMFFFSWLLPNIRNLFSMF